MSAETFEIVYAAHTANCTFLLDADGICRKIVVVPSNKGRDGSRNAARCVGAQYVASLDAGTPGCLVEMPRVGASMLFARVDERGRVALVRTGVVTFFEQSRPDKHDPFDSVSVKTSAPELPPQIPRPPRTQRLRDPDAPDAPERAAPPSDLDYDEDGENEKTQRIQALRPQDLARFHFDDASEPDLKTAEYASQPAPPPSRTAHPSSRRTVPSSNAPTLRTPPKLEGEGDEQDPYAARTRGMLPRRPDSGAAKRRSGAWHGEPKVASRRRDR